MSPFKLLNNGLVNNINYYNVQTADLYTVGTYSYLNQCFRNMTVEDFKTFSDCSFISSIALQTYIDVIKI